MKFNDRVEMVHRILVDESKRYRALLLTTYDAHAVEGSLVADDIMAAQMLRYKAIELRDTEIAEQKLATILLALKVVLRRYHASRKQRRDRGCAFTVTPEGEIHKP